MNLSGVHAGRTYLQSVKWKFTIALLAGFSLIGSIWLVDSATQHPVHCPYFDNRPCYVIWIPRGYYLDRLQGRAF